MSSDKLPHAHTQPASAIQDADFRVWSRTGWIVGSIPWLLVLYVPASLVWVTYHDKQTPLADVWLPIALIAVVTSVGFAAHALYLALYVGWVAFTSVRVTGDRITVGRWLGARTRIHHARDIATWSLAPLGTRDARGTTPVKRLRIEFVDGSWIAFSPRARNFSKLHAWVCRAASDAGDIHNSGASRSTHRFVAHDRVWPPMLLSGWVLYWIMVGFKVVTGSWPPWFPPSPDWLHPSGPGDVVLLTLWGFLGVLMPLFLGPLYLNRVLHRLQIDAPYIHVRRWFGLMRQTYREGDIEAWRASFGSNSRRWRPVDLLGPSIQLRFADGAQVFALGEASNLRTLHTYLRERAPSRQDVRDVPTESVPVPS